MIYAIIMIEFMILKISCKVNKKHIVFCKIKFKIFLI